MGIGVLRACFIPSFPDISVRKTCPIVGTEEEGGGDGGGGGGRRREEKERTKLSCTDFTHIISSDLHVGLGGLTSFTDNGLGWGVVSYIILQMKKKNSFETLRK